MYRNFGLFVWHDLELHHRCRWSLWANFSQLFQCEGRYRIPYVTVSSEGMVCQSQPQKKIFDFRVFLDMIRPDKPVKGYWTKLRCKFWTALSIIWRYCLANGLWLLCSIVLSCDLYLAWSSTSERPHCLQNTLPHAYFGLFQGKYPKVETLSINKRF